VEVEHIKTTIISLHEEYKIVEDRHKDTKNYRDKENNHKDGSDNINGYVDKQLKP
jgi:hypothetical protein